jgi:chromosome segregation ATPase
MSDEELVKRLRGWAKDIQEGSTAIYAMDLDLKNAASSIEALTEQLEAARADAKEAEAYADELAGDLTELCSQLIAAEDKMAKAVEGLRAVDALDPEGMIDGCSQYALRGLVLRMGEISRATLAEIEGEKG